MKRGGRVPELEESVERRVEKRSGGGGRLFFEELHQEKKVKVNHAAAFFWDGWQVVLPAG